MTDKKIIPKKDKKVKTESKAETFIRLAKLRTEKVLKSLKILGNCSNSANYEYNEAQINQIFHTIEKMVNDTKTRFSGKTKDIIKFDFK